MKTPKYALVGTLALVGLMAPNAAWGDSIEYTISGTFGGGTTTLTGTLIIDSTTGQTISGTVTTTGSMALGPLPLHVSDQPVAGDWNDKFNNGGLLPTVDFAYNWPPSSLSSIPLISPITSDPNGFCGPNVCGIFISVSPFNVIRFDGGSLTQTPEPSSLLLLGTGTGLLGVGLLLRRRFGVLGHLHSLSQR